MRVVMDERGIRVFCFVMNACVCPFKLGTKKWYVNVSVLPIIPCTRVLLSSSYVLVFVDRRSINETHRVRPAGGQSSDVLRTVLIHTSTKNLLIH